MSEQRYEPRQISFEGRAAYWRGFHQALEYVTTLQQKGATAAELDAWRANVRRGRVALTVKTTAISSPDQYMPVNLGRRLWPDYKPEKAP